VTAALWEFDPYFAGGLPRRKTARRHQAFMIYRSRDKLRIGL
jgi:hypothetical protein